MEPSSKKRRLESGRCEQIQQPDLEAQRLFAEMREAVQQKTLTVDGIDGFENQFRQILQKHKSHISDLKNEVTALRSRVASRSASASAATEAKQAERTADEFRGEERIAMMTKVQFANPKGKMFVEFFPSYMTIRPQTRYDSAQPAIVCFDDIDILISVPTKHTTSSLTVLFMRNKVPLRYQKANRSSSAFCIKFESTCDPEDYQVDVNVSKLNGKADFKSVMKGSREHIFNEIISKLSGLSIHRHDKNVFRSAMGNTQFFVTSAIGASTGDLYPLRCGLLFTKPLMLIPVSNIKSFHSGRDTNGTGLRFFDFDVVRKEVVGKQKKSESFSMISVQESPGIMAYFNMVKIQNTAVVEAARRKKEAESQNDEEKQQGDGKEKENNDSNKTSGGGEEEDGHANQDSDMESDDSMFDLEEELNNYSKNQDDDDSDGDYEDSGGDSSEDDMAEMRKVAAKEKAKGGSSKEDVKHDIIRARNDGVCSSSSTESDASMNEPLFPTSVDSDVEMAEPTKGAKKAEMKNVNDVVVAQPVDETNRPRRWKRRGRKPQTSSDNENKKSSQSIEKFFTTST